MTAPTPTQLARVLLDAADVIDRNGLAKSGGFYDPTDGKPPRECPVCAYGAMDVAAGVDPGGRCDDGAVADASRMASREFRKFLGANVIRWSDAPDTSAAQVSAEMRRCAKWLERAA